MDDNLKLVILDRDGVINEDSDAFVKSEAEWVPLPGAIEAVAGLSRAGFTLVVATNQSGLARGLFDLDDLEAMHAKMGQLVESHGGSLSAVFYCPHGPDDGCNCRKPKSGLIDAIEAEFDTSASGVPLVGDSLRDLEAGISKGCEPVLVLTGKGRKTLESIETQKPAWAEKLVICEDLAAAAQHIQSVYG